MSTKSQSAVTISQVHPRHNGPKVLNSSCYTIIMINNEAGDANMARRQTDRGARVLTFAPAVGAFCYPYFVAMLYESGQRISLAKDAAAMTVAYLSLFVSVLLIYGVPALALTASLKLGRLPLESSFQIRVRRLVQFVFASPSLFVFIGTTFYMLGSSNRDYIFWAVLWIVIIAALSLGRNAPARASVDVPPIGLRRWHGISALCIVVIFLAWHFLNHLSALVSLDFNKAMMEVLRKWYRSEPVQPVIVGLFVFQTVSGLLLFRYRTSVEGETVRILQTITGVFLSAFIVSHLSAVFLLGRLYSGVDTTFRWAAGAPAGLFNDPWNVRLIPHYSLVPWVVLTHLGLGVRGILLGRGYEPAAANRIVRWFGAGGLAVALLITVALLRVRG